MVILCSLLPDLFCPIINLLKKKCYHGTQCSAGDMKAGDVSCDAGHPANIRWVYFAHVLQVCLLETTDSNGTGRLVWLRSLWTQQMCEGDVLQASDLARYQNLDREQNAGILMN